VLNACQLMVIEPRPTHAGVVPLKTQGVNQVKTRASIGTQPNHVAGVGRNFWLVEDDVKHC
jgi:hypothetical protein